MCLTNQQQTIHWIKLELNLFPIIDLNFHSYLPIAFNLKEMLIHYLANFLNQHRRSVSHQMHTHVKFTINKIYIQLDNISLSE